jgi:hypothetical protein
MFRFCCRQYCLRFRIEIKKRSICFNKTLLEPLRGRIESCINLEDAQALPKSVRHLNEFFEEFRELPYQPHIQLSTSLTEQGSKDATDMEYTSAAQNRFNTSGLTLLSISKALSYCSISRKKRSIFWRRFLILLWLWCRCSKALISAKYRVWVGCLL